MAKEDIWESGMSEEEASHSIDLHCSEILPEEEELPVTMPMETAFEREFREAVEQTGHGNMAEILLGRRDTVSMLGNVGDLESFVDSDESETPVTSCRPNTLQLSPSPAVSTMVATVPAKVSPPQAQTNTPMMVAYGQPSSAPSFATTFELSASLPTVYRQQPPPIGHPGTMVQPSSAGQQQQHSTTAPMLQQQQAVAQHAVAETPPARHSATATPQPVFQYPPPQPYAIPVSPACVGPPPPLNVMAVPFIQTVGPLQAPQQPPATPTPPRSHSTAPQVPYPQATQQALSTPTHQAMAMTPPQSHSTVPQLVQYPQQVPQQPPSTPTPQAMAVTPPQSHSTAPQPVQYPQVTQQPPSTPTHQAMVIMPPQSHSTAPQPAQLVQYTQPAVQQFVTLAPVACLQQQAQVMTAAPTMQTVGILQSPQAPQQAQQPTQYIYRGYQQ